MKPNTKKIILGVAIVLAGVAGVLVYQNRTNISDWFSGLSYTATPELSALEDSLNLTDSGKTILHATHPSLESRDDFNKSCDSHNKEISILGCYAKNRIHIYDINSEELNGVKESTMAHELLHAVWDRLPNSEKDSLSKKLTAVFEDERYNSLLSEDLESYADADRMDELHSRIGTEIVELPEELENHYAKYFKDQDTIVIYYNDYIAPFRELSQKIEELSAKIESLSVEIDDKTKAYYDGADQLSGEIDEFNNCAGTVGCFKNDSDFRNRRNELATRKEELDNEYNAVNELINQYNAFVKEYNDSIVRGQTLESIINSNSKVEDKDIK